MKRFEGRDNAFDVLRLVAALLVLFSHCYALTRLPEPFAQRTGETLGAFGVSMFFAISGWLIAGSWERDPRPAPYAAKRLLRLLPGVVVAALLTAFVLGPLVSTVSLGAYFGDAHPWLYVLKSLTLAEHDLTLPGVFPPTQNVYPYIVNGSLWTLPVEAGCYLLVAILGVLALDRRPAVLVVLVVVALLATTSVIPVTQWFKELRGDAGVFFDVETLVRLVAQFCLGMLLWRVRDRIPWRWPILGVLAVLWVLSWQHELDDVAAVLLVGYGVILLGYRLPRRVDVLTRPGDLSYGLYVYAFPVQQTVLLVGPFNATKPGVLMLIATPITYALALASWRLVEQPALRLKDRLRPLSS